MTQEMSVNNQLKVKEVIDLSVSLKSLDTPIYPGYPQPLRTTYSTIRDNGYASFVWMFVEHTATHVDAPAHFVPGTKTVDEVPLERYVGPGAVLDFSQKPPMYSISRSDISSALKNLPSKVGSGWTLLFYTGYTNKAKSSEWLNHPELSEDACNYIVELGVNSIGFDAPGPDHTPFPAHKILLSNTIGNYENLANLDKLLGKNFLFVGAPLALTGGSASPVRALALVF